MKILIKLNDGDREVDRQIIIAVPDDDQLAASDRIKLALDAWVLAPGHTIEIKVVS